VTLTSAADLPILAVVGATASGKSALAMAVAELMGTRGGAEIINADSMQFYRGMDIGTAKVSLDDRARVAHHQLDTLDVHQDASVARYQEDGRADIAAIRARGALPIVVGGSGLYLRGLLDRFEFPGTDPALRAALEERIEREGPGMMYAELADRDPQAAAKIHPRNAKRIVRALEILELAGEYTSSLPRHEFFQPTVMVALHLPFELLDRRIEQRVDAMFAAGLVDEVRALVDRGIRDAVTARRAVGYAEVLAMLDGELTEDQARDLICRNTRRLARRQERWLRPDPRVVWVDAPVDDAGVGQVARSVCALVERGPTDAGAPERAVG